MLERFCLFGNIQMKIGAFNFFTCIYPNKMQMQKYYKIYFY